MELRLQQTNRSRNNKQQTALPLRAAIYARHSSNKQNPRSCDEQISHIKYLIGKGEVCSRLNPGSTIEVVPTWTIKDEAISGRSVTRIGYQLILDSMSKKGKQFDLLLLDDMTRAGRDLGNIIDLYDRAQYSGIEIISVSDNLSSADPNAKIFFTVKGMVGDFSNEAHAMRTLRGMEQKVLKGLSCGDLPYGYKSKPSVIDDDGVGRDFKIYIDESQAQPIRRVFKLFAEGYGRSTICKTLNEEKIPWPGFHYKPAVGQGWNPSSIFRMLNNEKYIGIWTWKQTVYKINPSTGKKVRMKRPPHQWVSFNEGEKCRDDLRIISQSLWNKVHKVFEQIHANDDHGIWGRYLPNVPRYMLSGILKCTDCGDNFVLISGRKGGYYGCLNANRRGVCPNKRLIRRLKVEKAVVNFVTDFLTDGSIFQRAADLYNQQMNEKMAVGRENVGDYEQELAIIEVELKNATDAVMKGAESETILKAIEEREKRKRLLAYQIQQIKASQQEKIFVTPMAMKERFGKLTQVLNKQPRAAAEALKKIFPDGLKMKWADGCWTISGTMALGSQGGMEEVNISLK